MFKKNATFEIFAQLASGRCSQLASGRCSRKLMRENILPHKEIKNRTLITRNAVSFDTISIEMMNNNICNDEF